MKKTWIAAAAFGLVVVTMAGADRAPKTASFDVRHELEVTVADGTKSLKIWFVLPAESDPAQKVSDLEIESPYPHKIVTDSEGNRLLYVEVSEPKQKEFSIIETFSLTRSEVVSGVAEEKARPISEEERAKHAKHLEGNANVPIDDEIKALARKIVGDETNPVRIARKLYDWELGEIEYWVKDPKNRKASPVGSTKYCLENKTGNCTDFHSLWTSLARASGIPTRMVYGSFFKLELAGIDQDQSYHCWPEFFVPGVGWVPHDVAVADIFKGTYPVDDANARLIRLTTANGYAGEDPSMVEYYFGNIDERRVTWTWGRDLQMSPKQDGGPVNALPKAYVEADGKLVAEKAGWTRKLTYRNK